MEYIAFEVKSTILGEPFHHIFTCSPSADRVVLFRGHSLKADDLMIMVVTESIHKIGPSHSDPYYRNLQDGSDTESQTSQ